MNFSRDFRNKARKWFVGTTLRNDTDLPDAANEEREVICVIAPKKNFVFDNRDFHTEKSLIPIPIYSQFSNTVNSAEKAFIVGTHLSTREITVTQVKIEGKDLVYYIGAGIILNEAKIPIMMASTTDNAGIMIHLDISVLRNQTEFMNKFILKKLIPYVFEQLSVIRPCYFSIVNAETFVIKPSWRRMMSDVDKKKSLCEIIDLI